MARKREICGTCLTEKARGDTPWKVSHLRWYVRDAMPEVMLEAFRGTAGLVFTECARVCGLSFEQSPSERGANIIMTAGTIDGPGGTLAWSNLPPTNPCMQKYDTGERWNSSIDLFSVVLHEVGHALGMPHGSAGVMKPYYAKTNGWYQADVDRLVAMYGPPKPVPTPGPGEPEDPKEPDDPYEILIKATGAEWSQVRSDEKEVTIRLYKATKIEIPGWLVTPL